MICRKNQKSGAGAEGPDTLLPKSHPCCSNRPKKGARQTEGIGDGDRPLWGPGEQGGFAGGKGGRKAMKKVQIRDFLALNRVRGEKKRRLIVKKNCSEKGGRVGGRESEVAVPAGVRKKGVEIHLGNSTGPCVKTWEERKGVRGDPGKTV